MEEEKLENERLSRMESVVKAEMARKQLENNQLVKQQKKKETVNKPNNYCRLSSRNTIKQQFKPLLLVFSFSAFAC